MWRRTIVDNCFTEISMSTVLRCSFATLAIAGLMTASPALASKEVTYHPGVLIVEDSANLFSRDAIRQAKEEFATLKSTHERQVTIQTLASLPAADAEALKKIESNDKAAMNRFWSDFTKKEARADRAKGVFILVCRSPGHVHVIADKPMRDQGFTDSKESNIRQILFEGFAAAAKEKDAAVAQSIRDKGLMAAVNELRYDVPVTTNPTSTTKNGAKDAPSAEHINWTKWICIGISVLLGLWLVIGLIRAFSGGGGGGGGGYGGGGGGGGGFFTGLLGGMFGAMAGMWLYNNMFGGGTSSAFGGDSGSTGDAGSGTESGTGDFSGDDGSGGDFDGGSGGDAGGGDWGGGGDAGGGDWGGGGGDFGGGGGDFGGGGGDF
jgi:hypothetical protein